MLSKVGPDSSLTLNFVDGHGNTALHMACCPPKPLALDFILKDDRLLAKINAKNVAGKTPIQVRKN